MIGVDICEIERFETMKNLDKFMLRFFTSNEILYLEDKKIESVAGIFSAKESILKALGLGILELPLKDIEINHDEKGKPQVCLYKKAREVLSDLGYSKVEISISHSKKYAVSFAILQRE